MSPTFANQVGKPATREQPGARLIERSTHRADWPRNSPLRSHQCSPTADRRRQTRRSASRRHATPPNGRSLTAGSSTRHCRCRTSGLSPRALTPRHMASFQPRRTASCHASQTTHAALWCAGSSKCSSSSSVRSSRPGCTTVGGQATMLQITCRASSRNRRTRRSCHALITRVPSSGATIGSTFSWRAPRPYLRLLRWAASILPPVQLRHPAGTLSIALSLGRPTAPRPSSSPRTSSASSSSTTWTFVQRSAVRHSIPYFLLLAHPEVGGSSLSSAVWQITFCEVVRQVYVHCAERGMLLDRVRRWYDLELKRLNDNALEASERERRMRDTIRAGGDSLTERGEAGGPDRVELTSQRVDVVERLVRMLPGLAQCSHLLQHRSHRGVCAVCGTGAQDRASRAG